MSLSRNARTIFNIVKSEGSDPAKLTNELRKKSVQAMTLKERCEHINGMRIPYGVLRCTPNLLLRKWLGIDIQHIIAIGNSAMMQIADKGVSVSETGIGDPKEFLTKSAFHVSYINGGEIYDYGFFIGTSVEDIEQIIKEGVVDLSNENQAYACGLGPQSFQKISSEGGYNVEFM